MRWSKRRERLRAVLTGTTCVHPGTVFDPISARIAGPVTLTSKTTTGGAADGADVTFTSVTGASRFSTRAASWASSAASGSSPPPRGASRTSPSATSLCSSASATASKPEARRATNAPRALHPAYLRLAGANGGEWPDSARFYAHVSKVMRSVLVDQVRRRSATKRGAARRVQLEDQDVAGQTLSFDLLSLDVLIGELEQDDPDRAAFIECRVFGGMTLQQLAELRGESLESVKNRWSVLGTWLRRELRGEDEAPRSSS